MKKITLIIITFFLPLVAFAGGRNLVDEEGGNSSFWELSMVCLSLLLGGTAILLHFRSLKKTKSKFQRLEVNNRNFIETQQANFNLVLSAQANKADRNELASLQEQLSFLDSQVKKLAQPVREVEWTGLLRKNTSAESLIEKLANTVADTQQETERYYAKLADLDNGFSPAVLQLSQNGEQVFEIITTGDEATYRISSDTNAQRYALAESTFTLGKACELANQPFKGCQIVMDREGSLDRVSGNWIFRNKAKIAFR